MSKIIMIASCIFLLVLMGTNEPKAITKCKSLIGKNVKVNNDTLTIVNYTYSLYIFDDLKDEFILSNGTIINFYDIDKFLIN